MRQFFSSSQQAWLILLTHSILTSTAATIPCQEPAPRPAAVAAPIQAQHVLLVPVYQPQYKATIQEAEGYAEGYESSKTVAPAPPPPPPPCQPCQQYQVLASVPPPQPQPKAIFTPSAAFYARGSIGLGAYFSKVTIIVTFIVLTINCKST